MAIWRLCWIGHAYGHGMGSFGAGYPLNDTWPAMGEAARRLQKAGEFLGKARERVRIAVYHSWETPAFFNDNFAQLSKSCMMHMSLELVNSSTAFDFICSEQLAEARLDNRMLMTGSGSFDCLIIPWGCMMPAAVWENIGKYARQGGKVIFCGPPVLCATDGRDLSKEFFSLVGVRPFSLADYQQAYLHRHPFPVAPTMVNLFHFPLQAMDCDVCLPPRMVVAA